MHLSNDKASLVKNSRATENWITLESPISARVLRGGGVGPQRLLLPCLVPQAQRPRRPEPHCRLPFREDSVKRACNDSFRMSSSVQSTDDGKFLGSQFKLFPCDVSPEVLTHRRAQKKTPKQTDREGFEPTESASTFGGLVNRCLKPLGHLSKYFDTYFVGNSNWN